MSFRRGCWGRLLRRPLLLAVLLALPVLGEWPRWVITGKGYREDRPVARPLAYFTENPWLHNEADWERTPGDEGKKSRTELKPVGTFAGFPVFDLFYFFDGSTEPRWKSILVKTGADAYQEIHHDHPIEARLKASFALTVGKDRYVCVVDNLFQSYLEEQCYWIGPSGSVRVDLQPIWDAAQKVAAPGKEIVPFGMGAERTFSVGRMFVTYYGRGEKGVEVWFSLARGRLRVTKAVADP